MLPSFGVRFHKIPSLSSPDSFSLRFSVDPALERVQRLRIRYDASSLQHVSGKLLSQLGFVFVFFSQ